MLSTGVTIETVPLIKTSTEYENYREESKISTAHMGKVQG